MGIAIGTILIGIAPVALFYLAIAGMFIASLMIPMTNGPLMAVVQVVVAPEMQGRVFTLLSSLAAAMSPLGLAIAGPLSDAVGVRTWFLLGGIVKGAMGLGSLFMPSVLNIEEQRGPDLKTADLRDEVVLTVES